MADKLGIENLKKCLAVLVEGGNVGGQIAALPQDAGWFARLQPVANILDEVYDLSKVDWKSVIPEFKDLDEAEIAELKLFFEQKFDIPQDGAEVIVEKALGILINAGEVVKEIIALAKEVSALKQ